MFTNQLAKEHSPYLRQHQHNPVEWMPWGDKAFEKAKSEGKPIFLSIGYSTCYWCHVMEKESFEREDVAEILNKAFVSIKVDREERPDVDAIYMDAIVSMTGHGGWPMSVFLTPELKPFFGGTYFPRDQFISLLTQIDRAWREHPDQIAGSAKELFALIDQQPGGASGVMPSPDIFQNLVRQLHSSFDPIYGGFSPAPKFPPSGTLAVLLRAAGRSNQPEPLAMAEKTLQRMARGGLFDHLGGGFHRYSTDRKWLVPHFEKMLYDNAQLAVVYLEAFQCTKNDLYLSVARETLDYVLERMSNEQGGYFSAEDAGEVGKEGEYYVWAESELRTLLTAEELSEMKRLYGVTSLGNFEDGQNILNLQDHTEWSEKYDGHARAAIEKLKDARSRREQPHRDDKVLTSWNGLMISAMARGYLVLGDVAYLRSAEQTAEFLQKNLTANDELLHRFYEGHGGVPGMLDDYAFLIQGLLDLYQVSGTSRWYSWACSLQQTADELFWDAVSKSYFSTSAGDTSLITRKRELPDGAEPSGNGVMARNLVRLLHYDYQEAQKTRVADLLQTFAAVWERHPSAFSSALLAYDLLLGPSKEIVIAGERNQEEIVLLVRRLQEEFLPRVIFAWADSGEDDALAPPITRMKQAPAAGAAFFVCEKNTCQAPVHSAAEVFSLIVG